jgi:hypothetical protein
MSGTKAGGLKARATNKEKYGEDFYATIGAKGGKLGTTGGFAVKTVCDCNIIEGDHYRGQCRGKIGGMKSKRPKKVANG